MSKTNGRSSAMRQILGLLRPYGGQVALILLLAVVVVVSTLLLPVFSGNAVDAAVGPHEVDFTALALALRDMALAIAATAASQWLLTRLTNRVVYGMVYDLRTRAFAKLQRLPLAYIDAHSHGDIVSRVVTDVDQFSNGLIMAFQQFFTGVLTIVLTLVFMFRLNVQVALVVVCITPLSILLARFISSKSYRHFRRQTERRGAMTSYASEMIGGISSIEAFDHADAACREFDGVCEELRRSQFKAVFYSALTNPGTRFVNNLVYAGVGIVGAFVVLGGCMTVGSLSAFLGYANQYTKPFNDISEVVTELQNSVACAARLFDLLAQDEITPDKTDAVVLSDATGRVDIDDVSFSYTPDRPLIGDFDLAVQPGQRIAIVGPTGCGKTTLINLLMRFYDVNGGSVRFDGHDVRDLTRASLRSQIGMVLQDTWIEHATVRENIAMAQPDATLDEIKAAAHQAHADKFIEQLPHGYDTMLGGDAASLSAGQRQLLCIARVFLAEPRILILDEATSNIDTRTELHVQHAFDRLMEGHTSFVVAHRLSTIQNADKIVVMRDGHIVETGTHDELLARGGFYANLFNAQFAPVE